METGSGGEVAGDVTVEAGSVVAGAGDAVAFVTESVVAGADDTGAVDTGVLAAGAGELAGVGLLVVPEVAAGPVDPEPPLAGAEADETGSVEVAVLADGADDTGSAAGVLVDVAVSVGAVAVGAVAVGAVAVDAVAVGVVAVGVVAVGVVAVGVVAVDVDDATGSVDTAAVETGAGCCVVATGSWSADAETVEAASAAASGTRSLRSRLITMGPDISYIRSGLRPTSRESENLTPSIVEFPCRGGGGGGSRTRVRSSVLQDLYECVRDIGSRLRAPPDGIPYGQPRFLSGPGAETPPSPTAGFFTPLPDPPALPEATPGIAVPGTRPYRLRGESEPVVLVGTCVACAVTLAPSTRSPEAQLPRRSQTPPRNQNFSSPRILPGAPAGQPSR